MKTNDIRSKFLEYFKNNGHQIVASSSLVPENDPSLLFTNSGMVQFKDVFLGQEQRDYVKAVTAQRCVRAGGKHNDLENVGYTARHHTFFEMMGNFSFGDYFKEKAIQLAWDFITGELKLAKDKLWITIYQKDDEAYQIWHKTIGLDEKRIIRIDSTDNFWSMGNTGPCGPCTEIFYDHGDNIEGGLPGSENEDGDRYIEIWNLVFMQYNRLEDGTLVDLPKPSVDTGMGLERVAAVLQGVHSNYQIDTFVKLIKAAAKLVNTKDLSNKSLQVIADHIRSTSFLILDGVTPSNEGRGYVLRRIIRRAIRHGYQLGCRSSFMAELVDTLAEEMGNAYPELIENKVHIKQVLNNESERFALTLENGIKLLDEAMPEIKNGIIDGELVFKLYDTFGFPVDLTEDIARENNLSIDLKGFEQCMAKQRKQARASSQFTNYETTAIQGVSATRFTGYESTKEKAKIQVINQNGKSIEKLQPGDKAVLILDNTPFYAESGGQVADKGQIITNDAVFDVEDTQKFLNKVIAHHGVLRLGTLKSGDQVEAKIDSSNRRLITANHSATHLLNSALRTILGTHVKQKGSLVENARLRFDFSHQQSLSKAQLQQIQIFVNEQIQENHPVIIKQMSLTKAKAAGAMALFGEKYEEQVRVVEIGPLSLELCGGTHVKQSGDIGLFKILGETAVASGIRRIEAVTGLVALNQFNEIQGQVQEIAQRFKVPQSQLLNRIDHLIESHRQQSQKIQSLENQLIKIQAEKQISQTQKINGVDWLIIKTNNKAINQLREQIDTLKSKLKSGVILLVNSNQAKKLDLLIGVTDDLLTTYHAGKLINQICQALGGKGGGRANLAQGGAPEVKKLDSVLAELKNLV